MREEIIPLDSEEPRSIGLLEAAAELQRVKVMLLALLDLFDTTSSDWDWWERQIEEIPGLMAWWEDQLRRRREEAERVRLRREDVRARALARLTDEEKEALGLAR